MKTVKLVRFLFTLPIRFYRRFISSGTAAKCKYYPTCSQYAITAIEKHGIIFGTGLAVWRILRCNPWSKGGIDPVPEKLFTKHSKEK